MRRCWFRPCGLGLAAVVLGLAIGTPAATGEPREFLPVDPKSFGLDIPPGPVEQTHGEAVLTHDEQQRPVVARLCVRVGDHVVVLLPDGQLVARSGREVSATDRKFEPASREEIARELTSTLLPGFHWDKTRHYVYVYNTSPNFALATSRILESMIPGMMAHSRSQRVDVHDPEVPLVALMFRNEAEFQAYRRMPPGVVAYYHTLTNRIVMFEQTALGQIKPELAVQQAISTIAHEGAHQILHNIGVQKRLSVWPMWISEGLAEYYAPTTFGRKLKWKGAGEVNDMRMFEMELYLKGLEANHAGGEMVESTVQAARLTSTGYASAWSLTHYLARMKRDVFNAYVRDVSRLGPLQTTGEMLPTGVVPANMTLFEKHFGDNSADLESRVVRHLQGLPYRDPFAEWPHFVAMIIVENDRRAERDANLFHTAELAQKWISERLESASEAQRNSAQSRIQPFPNRALAEQHARRWLSRGR